ncbi:hypothetical protein IFM89_011608 [Coptis chinensis]|uniref:Endonuclease/exonuclease/phosphatase domain-containing protein n=1 Tax=Coptis chinensis TaxID=261450 RepID=A0A835H291_9MAGN|nr:hypothetical protein IFM89_011608 [Coptis chinensis]
MGCNTLCYSLRSPPLPKTSPIINTYKCHFLFKPNLFSCTKNSVDKCINLNKKKQSCDDQLDIVRLWVDSKSSLSFNSEERFKVVSYNILGVRNASKHSDLYLQVRPDYLKWEHRKRLICEELIGLDSDIICLQEVDKYNDLLKIMEEEGYVGTYKRRTGDTVDGCAMFWKADKFRLLEVECIEFKEFGLRDNVAQISVFEIRLLLSRAHALAEKWGSVPIVLAGDFNSTPQSAVYQFLSSSELDVSLYDKRYLSGQLNPQYPEFGDSQGHLSRTIMVMRRFINYSWTDEELRTATGKANGTRVEHPLNLNSSYASVKITEGTARTRDSNGEPLATSFHSKFLGTVDYLW